MWWSGEHFEETRVADNDEDVAGLTNNKENNTKQCRDNYTSELIDSDGDNYTPYYYKVINVNCSRQAKL